MQDYNELIVYTDWHGVTITDCHFYTKKGTYTLNLITDVTLVRKGASVWMVITLFLTGLGAVLAGAGQLLTYLGVVPPDGALDLNLVLLIAGLVLIVLSGIAWVAAPGKYAVGIRTADGLHEAVESTKRKHAEHLVYLLRSAYRENIRAGKQQVYRI